MCTLDADHVRADPEYSERGARLFFVPAILFGKETFRAQNYLGIMQNFRHKESKKGERPSVHPPR